MKRLLLLVAVFLGISAGAAQATCTGPAVMKDNNAATFSMNVVQDSNGNCDSSVAVASAAPVPSTAAEATHVLKASAGILYSLDVTIGATTGWVMIFDATTAPADGAVTPKFCRYIKSDGTGGATSLAWVNPLSFATGISVAFSSTGCFTKTGSATAFFEGQVL